MPILKINDVRINYLQIDCEAGRNNEDIVMVHGLATSLAFWYFHHATVFSKNYRVTLFDLRGHGRSGIPRSGYTPKHMASDLHHLLDHLQIEHAHFVAHSFGGAVALNLACLEPGLFDSLILVDTHISKVRRLKKQTEWPFGKKLQPVLIRNGLDININDPYFGYRLLTEIARLQIKNVQVSPELEDLVNPARDKKNSRTAEQWLELLETTTAGHELMGDDGLSLDSLRELRFPILAMFGEDSQTMATGNQLLRVWPHACFRKLREAGHFFPISRPAEFIENCRCFWEGAFNEETSLRKGEGYGKHFRSDRLFHREGRWYLYTRETPEIGPFADREEAEQHLLRLSRGWKKGGR